MDESNSGCKEFDSDTARNNAVAVVDGIVRMEKWIMVRGEKNLWVSGSSWTLMDIGFNPYTRGPEF